MNDDAKRAVLARRARFIAAAVAGLGVACGKENRVDTPPCLSPMVVEDAGNAQPQPCLQPVPPPPADGGK